MASGYDGSINIDSKVDTKGFNAGVKQMGGGLGSILGIVSKLGVAIGAAFAVGKLIAFAKESLIVAANYQRIASAARQVGATMGYSAAVVDATTGELIKMGIQGDIANKSFIDFARNGLDISLLPALARGSQDLNAFADSGVSSSEVMDRLMTGVIQLSPLMLRTAGVIVDTQEATRKWAEQNKRTTESMSDQEKQAAVLAETIFKLKAVEGLYELSQRTAAGQMSSNKRIMSDLMAKVGGPFQNALYIFVKTINQMAFAFGAAIGPGGQLHGLFVSLAAVAQWVANAFRSVAIWVASIFGIAIPAMEGIATTTDGAAGSLEGAAGAADDLADATAGAGKAAKGALAPFDELNVLQMDSGGGGGEGETTPGGGGGGGGVPFIPIDSGLLDEINAKLAEFSAAAKAFLQPIIDAFNRLVKASAPLRKTLWEGLQWLWENILVPFGTWVAGEVVPRVLDLLAEASVVLNEALVALKPLAIWLWEEWLKPIATWTGGQITTILDNMGIDLKNLGDWIRTNPEKFQVLVVVVGLLALAFWALTSPIGLVVVAFLAVIAIIAILAKYWPEITASFAEGWAIVVTAAEEAEAAIIKFFEDTWAWILKAAQDAWDILVTMWESLKYCFEEIVDFIKHLFKGSGLFDDIVTWAQEAWDKIIEIWNKVAAWFNDNVTQPIMDFFSGAWTAINAYFWAAIVYIEGVWGVIATWFDTNVIQPLSTFFSTAWENIKGFFSGAWTTISTAWSTVGEWFKTNVTDKVSGFFGTMLTGSADGTGTGGLVGFFSGVWTTISNAWKTIPDWFKTNVTEPIGKFFCQMLFGSNDTSGSGGIVGWFTRAVNGISSVAVGLINGVISFINGVFTNVGNAINGLITSINLILTKFGKLTIGLITIPQIPALATGAVIPPNAQFLALLGDQRSGRNIEAPENLIRQIVREESGGIGEKEITIRFEGTMGELIRQMKPHIDRENKRVGVSLINEGMA